VGQDGGRCRSDLRQKKTGIFLLAGLDSESRFASTDSQMFNRSAWRRAFRRLMSHAVAKFDVPEAIQESEWSRKPGEGL
jgi:hypothetical protein